jgi:hypothetical protein
MFCRMKDLISNTCLSYPTNFRTSGKCNGLETNTLVAGLNVEIWKGEHTCTPLSSRNRPCFQGSTSITKTSNPTDFSVLAKTAPFPAPPNN